MASRGMRWFGREGQAKDSRRKAPGRRVLGAFEALETRELMHGGCLVEPFQATHDVDDEPVPAAIAPADTSAQAGSSGSGSLNFLSKEEASSPSTKLSVKTVDQRTLDQQMGLPLLDSNLGAPVTIYLDFNGHFERDWFYLDENGNEVHYRNVSTPVFDTDSNTASYSASEQALIREVWTRVAEDFAPFRVNVSTAYYGTFNNGQALRVAIGGRNTDWLGMNSSGYAGIGSFRDATPNTVYVFDLAEWARNGVTDGEGRVINAAAALATSASHEAGHAFGLRHQSLYSGTTKINDYNPGTATWTPIMGNNLASDRTTWNFGPTDLGADKTQSEVDYLGYQFGYRPDDHANSTAWASSLTTNIFGDALTGKGLIHYMSDFDFFKFTTSTGQFQISVAAAQYGANLVPVVELWNASGRIAGPVTATGTRAVIEANISAGTYYVMVRSTGLHGDVGQYNLAVTFHPTTVLLASALTSSTSTTTTTTSSGTYQDPLLDQSTSTTLMASSSSMGVGQGATPMDAPVANPSATAKQKVASRAGLHDDLFALESFVDELGDLARLS